MGKNRKNALIAKGGSPHRNGNMQCGRFLQGAQVPPLLTHRFTNFQDVDSSIFPCPESDDRRRRVTKDVEIRYLGFNTVDNLPSSGNDGPR